MLRLFVPVKVKFVGGHFCTRPGLQLVSCHLLDCKHFRRFQVSLRRSRSRSEPLEPRRARWLRPRSIRAKSQSVRRTSYFTNRAGEVAMTRQVVYCFEDQDIEEAERVMEKHQIRRLPVLDRDKRIVGIVSLGDFATKDDETRTGETLERVSEPSRWRWSEPRIY